MLVVDRSRCRLYELFDAHPLDGGARWHAGSGAIFNLRSNRLRPRGWTSADAAGLPILPGLARYGELRRGRINHALRFTASRTRRAFIYPARHFASSLTDPDLPAMGQRLRLKRGFDISRFPRQSRIVLRALKRYGMILADNGSSWYVSGAPNRGWDNDDLHSLHGVTGQRVRGRGQLPFAPSLGVGSRMRPVRVGCSGWQYDSWRGRLYPEGLAKGRWLERYSQVFDTVEVNSTFYRLASADAVARWVEQTPPDFLFAAKASRYMTHIKRLQNLAEGIGRYYEGIEPLVESGKLGPIVWQFPANFKRDLDRLGGALPLLPPGRHCFEFRHESWFTEAVYKLLRAHGAALVIADHPRWPFQAHELTTDWTLVRLHHGHRGRRGNYSETELDEWARRIAEWRRRAEVFVYFNNDWEGFAVNNALSLKRRLQPSRDGSARAVEAERRASASSRSARRSRAASGRA